MYPVEPPFPGSANTTRLYSPITLSNEWPTLERLVFIILSACIGSTINGFFVSSFFVEHMLKKVGYVFIACVGLSDLIITGGVMPISAIVLLSGQWDTTPVCQVLQFFTEASTYCYSLFFSLVAAETYFRLCRNTSRYEFFMSMGIGLLSVLVFIISFAVAGIGTFFGLDYDYCERQHFGNLYFRCVTDFLLHVVPFFLTSYCLLASISKLRRRARLRVNYRRSNQYPRDYAMTNLNICAFIIYVLGWTPYLIILHEFPRISDQKFYICAWVGICRSLVTSILYCTLNKSFRRAFAYLFCYCCCKSTVPSSYRNRQSRVTAGNIRVHIMHQAVTMNRTRGTRCAAGIQETRSL